MRTTRFPMSEHVQLDLEPAAARALLEDAVARFGGECEVLDCGVSFRRQPSGLTPAEALDAVLADRDRSLWTMVLREGYGRSHWELCASSLGEPSHFLYVRCAPEEGRRLAADHGLAVTPVGG